MDDTRPNSGAVIIEDIKSVPSQRCPGLKASADLAPVHCSSKVRMNEVAKRNDENCTDSLAHVNKNFKEKLILNDRRKAKNGVNLKLGYTDVEVHCGSSQNCIKDKDKESLKKNAHPVESNNLSSHNDNCKMDSSSDLIEIHSKSSKSNSTNLSLSNSNISNGYEISEENSSNSILDNSINSDTSNSLDVSHSSTSTGARSRIHNRSSSPLNVSQAEKIDAHVNKVSKLKNEDHSQIFMPVCKTIESPTDDDVDVEYSNYENEYQMESIMKLIQRDLSEPYSIYTYRYFIHNWPKLCFLASVNNEIIGAIVCKLDVHKKSTVRGYIAMLAVDQRFRKRKIGSNLVQRAIRKMATDDADEVVLETEITNTSALKLYENLGFVRDKRLFRYYLNGVDALRLKLWLT